MKHSEFFLFSIKGRTWLVSKMLKLQYNNVDLSFVFVAEQWTCQDCDLCGACKWTVLRNTCCMQPYLVVFTTVVTVLLLCNLLQCCQLCYGLLLLCGYMQFYNF